MNVLALVALGAGIGLLALAAWRLRPLQARVSELDRLAENARRYDSWRGGRKTAAAGDETTGADVMRGLLRRQVRTWLAVGASGVALIVASFVLS